MKNVEQNHWNAVRPVRSSEEILDVLSFITKKKCSTIEDIRISLMETRENREEMRLRGLRIRKPTKDKRREKPDFLTKAVQILRVLRRANLVTKSDDIITPTELANEIIDKNKNKKSLEARTMILKALLNSKFEAYHLFIKKLAEKPVVVPNELSKRNMDLAAFLNKQGFHLNSWSFYILRDFFYNFGLLNFIKEKNGEIIYSTCSYDISDEKYLQAIPTPSGVIYYWLDMSMNEFIQKLTETYMIMSDGKWGRIVDLVEMREKFSKKNKVSEIQFNELIARASKESVSIRVTLSVGILRLQQRKNYLIKVVNLPKNDVGIPFTLVRVTKD